MDTWQARLERGDRDGAWVAFDADHGRLVRSVVRRLVSDPDQADEANSVVAAALSADDFARLRRYSLDDPSGASLASWLVVVVRRLVVDWLRREHGRRRVAIPTDLDEWRRAIYIARCLERLSAAEAYEALRADRDGTLAFPAFLRELRSLARTHPCPELRPSRSAPLVPVVEDLAVTVVDPTEVGEQSRRLTALLEQESPDLRLAIQLFVVEDLQASEVARLVGWPNAKAVYNRVGRALARMRETLAREGLGSDDL